MFYETTFTICTLKAFYMLRYVYNNVLKTQFDMNIIVTSPNERFNLRFL